MDIAAGFLAESFGDSMTLKGAGGDGEEPSELQKEMMRREQQLEAAAAARCCSSATAFSSSSSSYSSPCFAPCFLPYFDQALSLPSSPLHTPPSSSFSLFEPDWLACLSPLFITTTVLLVRIQYLDPHVEKGGYFYL